jgi:hypothetical protein
MVEALALPVLGMPSDAFKMTFTHESIPEKTSEVFNILQRDAAWQTALDLSYTRQILPPHGCFKHPRLYRRGTYYGQVMLFPRAVERSITIGLADNLGGFHTLR